MPVGSPLIAPINPVSSINSLNAENLRMPIKVFHLSLPGLLYK